MYWPPRFGAVNSTERFAISPGATTISIGVTGAAFICSPPTKTRP